MTGNEPEEVLNFNKLTQKELDVILRKIARNMRNSGAEFVILKKMIREEGENSAQRFRDLNAKMEVMTEKIEELEKRPPVGQAARDEKKEEPHSPTPDPEPSEQSTKAVMRVFKRSWER